MRYESYGKAIGPPARRCRSVGKMLAKCVSQAFDDGKMLAKCVPQRPTVTGLRPNALLAWLAVAKCSRGASPSVNPWQVFHSMYPERGLGRENRPFLARFARHASEMSWLWQDMRAMHPKCPANRRRRIHRAKILPGRGPFRCTDPSNHAWRVDLAIL